MRFSRNCGVFAQTDPAGPNKAEIVYRSVFDANAKEALILYEDIRGMSDKELYRPVQPLQK